MAARGKSILIILVVLVVVLAAGLFYLTSNMNGIVASLIEEQGSAATGTAVGVDGVDIRVSDATAALAGLSVANPAGFNGNAIELGGFSVTLDPKSLTEDTIVIKDVSVDGARVNVVQQGTKNNLRELLKGLQAGDSGETAPETQESGKKIIIERFSLIGASASVSMAELGEDREVTLPDLTLTDIGKATGGATGAQVAQQILKPVIESAMTSATAGAIKEKVGEKVNEAVGGFLKGLGKKKDAE